MDIKEILGENYQGSEVILDSFVKCDSLINNPKYKKIVCSISGGSDSDDLIQLCELVKERDNIDYIWFDTGLEYQATKDHLKYLEERYRIKIKHENAIMPIPLGCKTYGQPFISKFVSECIQRLQKHGFQWEDEPYEILVEKYPNCRSALAWWDNRNNTSGTFNIDRYKKLKEFMILNPPAFSISNKCCTYAKKEVASRLIKREHYDLDIVGVRRAENGVRATAIKSCFSPNASVGCDEYRPLYWYSNEDKKEFEKMFNVKHSDCYEVYGLERTGCFSCSFGRNFERELEIGKLYEPKLYKAACNIFGDAYEYTRRYREFRDGGK